uniref:Membrane-spanning 4-domains, subfamily A, member 2 n=1 Tax=Nannospalax galili TaxID=1026970 RepID=A0A8C6QME2_NANGA
MDTENKSRADLTLPNPQEPSSVPEIELLEVSPAREVCLPSTKQAWLTVLKKELEFLGATQILIGSICLCFGILVCSALQISGVAEEIFSSFKIGYPFWGAILFIISGFLSVMSERKNAVYLVRGRLGANIVSSISGGAGIVILILNLSNNSICIDHCKDLYDDDDCYVASFVTELVMMMLFLTILGFCSAVSLTIYGIREELKVNKVAEELLYEELNIYSPIYSELEDKGES